MFINTHGVAREDKVDKSTTDTFLIRDYERYGSAHDVRPIRVFGQRFSDHMTVM